MTILALPFLLLLFSITHELLRSLTLISALCKLSTELHANAALFDLLISRLKHAHGFHSRIFVITFDKVFDIAHASYISTNCALCKEHGFRSCINCTDVQYH